MIAIEEALGLFSSPFHLLKTCLSITRLEAKLAGLSVFPLLVFLCLFMVSLMGLWCLTLCLFGYLLMQALGDWVLSMGLLCLFNAALVGIILRCICLYLKRMSFEKTRAYLSDPSIARGSSPAASDEPAHLSQGA